MKTVPVLVLIAAWALRLAGLQAAPAEESGLLLPRCFSSNMVLPAVDPARDRKFQLLWGWVGRDQKVEILLPGLGDKPLHPIRDPFPKKGAPVGWYLPAEDLAPLLPRGASFQIAFRISAGGAVLQELSLTNVIVGDLLGLAARPHPYPAALRKSAVQPIRVLRVGSLDWDKITPGTVNALMPAAWEIASSQLLDDPATASTAFYVLDSLGSSPTGLGVILFSHEAGSERVPPYTGAPIRESDDLLSPACRKARERIQADRQEALKEYQTRMIELKREVGVAAPPPRIQPFTPRETSGGNSSRLHLRVIAW